ncbi:MAG: T9SS type A sorting domain-containing protein [Ignavibacteriales bacterium]|nr:T9SS type A sorting domain-containing protein [Ignavibacteriales bacterium]
MAEPFALKVPFEVWNTDENKQVNLLMWDRSGNPTVDGGKIWNTDNRVYAWVVNTDYSPDALDPLSDDVTNFATWNWVIYLSTFTTGDVIKISYPNPIQVGKDVFTLTAPGYTSYDATKAAQDVKEVNVFPNPYYGVNPNEINKYQRYVTFNHLPAKATIRLFNMGGQLVKTVVKDDQSQLARWNLSNERGLPVASGIYIAYIDMPELGKTKVLKVAIIQETQILDRF